MQKILINYFFLFQYGNNKWQFPPQLQITLVTAKNGSNVQQSLEEALNSMNISKLKKIQVILTNKQAYCVCKQHNSQGRKIQYFQYKKKRKNYTH